MKIYLAHPWIFSDSPYYKFLIEYPPGDVEYVNVKKDKFQVISSREILYINNLVKKGLRKIADVFKLPNIKLIVTKEDYDLIHCAHCLLKNKNTPWVADFEGAWQFWIGRPNKSSINAVRKILLSKNCKKIMPWTNTIKKQILKYFPQKEIKEKIEVVYPAVPLLKIKKKKKKDKITILYAARYFWIKGGLIALETLRQLKKKYDINEYFISNVPQEIKKKYREINIIDLVPQKKLFSYYYPNSDIFFYPSFIDTFGFSLLEAMSFGLSIVTINTPATLSRMEIVGKETGMALNINKIPNFYKIGKKEKEIISKFKKNLSTLIENSYLRNKMSKKCIKLIKNGKFSIKERNKKIKRIYLEALR